MHSDYQHIIIGFNEHTEKVTSWILPVYPFQTNEIFHKDTYNETKEKAKIRNRYKQVPHLKRDTIWESDKNTWKHHEPTG